MPIKSEVFIQTLQKSQNRHKISFAFEFNNKNTKKVFRANLPPPIQLSWIYPSIQLGLNRSNNRDFPLMCAPISELPSNIDTIGQGIF